MILAAVRDDAYNVVLFVHLLSFLVAFAPAVINPLLAKYLRREAGDTTVATWAGFAAFYTSKVALGALGLLLLTGIGMIFMSDEVWEFSQIWISLAFVVWIAIAGVVVAMILKGERQLAKGDMSAEGLVTKGGAIGTVLLAVMLYLMVFKPGL